MDLSTWSGVPQPDRIILQGQYTRLEPLDPVPASRTGFDAWLFSRAASKDPLYFAVIDEKTGLVEGRQSLLDINTDFGTAEIGHILWGSKIARSRVTTEAFFLMADYIFSLGYRRWQWRCNARNLPSRRAAERFGYRLEGIFRNHMVIKGENRDTAWYSITDDEWLYLREGFVAWLKPSNFDETGLQKQKLELNRTSPFYAF